jgi:LPXTG-motif cell wall-anchored protein
VQKLHVLFYCRKAGKDFNIMKKSKRILAMLLCVLTVMGTFFAAPLTASAADATVSFWDTGWDEARAANLWGGGTISGTTNFLIMYIAPDTMLYCLEPGAPLMVGDGLNINSYVDTMRTPSISEDGTVTRLLGRLFQYIDYGATGSPLNTDEGKALYIAARILTWEVTQGERDEDFNYVSLPAGYDSVRQAVDNSSMSSAHKNAIFGYYDYLVNAVQNHHKIPTFTRMSQSNAPTYELTDNNGTLSVTLTDNNGVLSNYDFSSNGNLNFSKNGNTLTVTAQDGFDGELLVTATSTTVQRKGVICYGDGAGGRQDTVAVGSPIDDPVRAYFKIGAAVGNLTIVKTSKNNGGVVSGFQFEVMKGNVNIGTFTSDSSGRISIPNLIAGTYTVREINLTDEFVQPSPNPVTVEVRSGQTATVNFDNVKKLGVITVQKSNSNPIMGDYSLAGAEFTVKDAGGTIVDTIITGANGKGESKPLPLGSYTVQESQAPWGFVIDRNIYTRTLSGSLGATEIVYCPEISVPERPQTGQVKITKLDAETAAIAQGDATLSGAVFDLLDMNGNLVERLYCGDNTFVVSKEIPLGSYTVKEVTPPRGYTPSQAEYTIQIDYAGQEIEINLVSTEVKNTVIKGNIQIVKHSDDPDPDVSPENEQVQKPLEGIVFEIHLKSAGSYENAKPTERDLITTDENGYARTKDLPYGLYTVTEVQGADEHKVCAPFDVFISEDGRTYYYIIENTAYFGKVKIIKTDIESGMAILQPGIEFKIKNVDTGEWVSQEILYPTPIVIDSYLTAPDGTLVMPEPLHFGNYELYEVQAPYGYLLSETPIPFKITSENPVEYLEITMPNAPVKGKVSVQKTGEVLTGAAENLTKDGVQYIPEYTVRGIAGAIFDIIAAEDIITPDGTVRAEAGTVVDTVTTGADGFATSNELYLGNYYAVETAVPYGFIIDETPIPFSLVYQDQYTALVSAETGLYNERANGKISLIKTAEEVKLDKDGGFVYVQAPARDIIFGLYAREDILNVDGEVIITAGSLMDILITDENGEAVSTRDIPFGAYYVREMTTHNNLVPSDMEYDAVFEYLDETTPLVTITVNNGEAIENYLIKGKIKIIKTNSDGEPLSDVEFTVTGADTGITVELVTDENGEAATGLLPYDVYTIIETKTQESYVLDEHQHTLLLSRDGETYEFGIVNEKIRGQIKVIKTDGTTKTPLEGVVFELKDADGNVIAELTTDKDGVALSDELVYGTYTLTEKSTGEAYLLDETPREITIKDHKTVVEMEIQNVRKHGKIKVFKTDGTTKAPLEGVVFEIFNSDGKVVATLTTDKDGIAITDWLDYGDYTVKEKTALTGYVLDETVHEIQIREHEKVYELALTNDKIPETPDTPETPNNPGNPKTGDDSNPGLWLGLAAIAVGGIIAFFIIRIKRKKDD